MTDGPLYRGWSIWARVYDRLRKLQNSQGISSEARVLSRTHRDLTERLQEKNLNTQDGRTALAAHMAEHILQHQTPPGSEVTNAPLLTPLTSCLLSIFESEAFFTLPSSFDTTSTSRSHLWEVEDHLSRSANILDHFDEAMAQLSTMVATVIAPLIKQHPGLVASEPSAEKELYFDVALAENLSELPEIIEAMVLSPFTPELKRYATTTNLKARLEYNLIIASGGTPGHPSGFSKSHQLPTKASAMAPRALIDRYLCGTPFALLFDCIVPIIVPESTRFEHHHIVAGTGHGKTQTLQHLILHDLDAVAAGRASIVVIDSQSDLINTISGLSIFAEGGALAGRLCLIDPTDIEWPVALNLFDVGMERINQYSPLDRERLINGIIELYDFVLGSLLDAGMTQKQSVIFRYITRLMLHIPNATIHTFRELLEDDGYVTYYQYIEKLSGSARAFFQSEFQSKEFTNTKKQVLRRLYGILENQTFERMFSHPVSKLDLFTEMNAGKVILINTAKDLLKENGTEIFGRFFIAMIAQAAQERAILAKEDRLPTFVYIDEANDYFDQNIGNILSQARKYNIGMVLAHQFLGQMDSKLQDALFANTSIKFAGGVSTKDARVTAAELRTDTPFIADQDKLSFAAFIKGITRHAVSISVTPGEMERLPRMSADERTLQRQAMRDAYAVHYSKVDQQADIATKNLNKTEASQEPSTEKDDGSPMPWE